MIGYWHPEWCPSVCLHAMLCIVAFRVGVESEALKLYQRVSSTQLPVRFFRRFCCRPKVYHLARNRTENKKAVLSQGEQRDAAVNFDTYRILQYVDNETFMYPTYVDSGASGAKASTKHLESRLASQNANARSRILGWLKSRRWSITKNLAPFQRYCRFLRLWPHPYSALILGVFQLHQIAHVGVYDGLISRKIIFEVFQPIWSRYLNVTDGQNVSAVQGHPRSLILVSIESAYMTSY